MKPKIKTILVPVDFSPCSLRAIAPATALAKINNSRIILLNILESRSTAAPPFYFSVPPPLEYENDLRDLSLKHLRGLALSIGDEGISPVEIHSYPGTPYAEIVRFARENMVDFIIMGTHGASGFNEFFIGTNASRVVGKSTCPVLTIQVSGEIRSFDSIVVPFKEDLGADASDYLVYLARVFKASVHLLLIEDASQRQSDLPPSALLIARLQAEGIKCLFEEITGSFRARQVISYAGEQKAGIILIEGQHDQETISDYFSGPFEQQIVNHSKIPVLSVRAPQPISGNRPELKSTGFVC
jgi:nucleotide-binding universal stress UspA family protein